MSPATRAYFGAALGALATLLIHPVSRPYMLTGLSRWGESKAAASSPLLVENLPRLPVPKSDLDASIWLQAGAERIWLRRMPEVSELETLASVAKGAADHAPDNAYWRQMEAVFLGVLGRRAEAEAAWIRAASAAHWNDLQSVRLVRVRESLVAEVGSRQSWQLAYLYRVHSPASAQVIRAFSRSSLGHAPLTEPEGLELRWASVMNAQLMRDGARAIESGQVAADMMEAASHPVGLPTARSHRVVLLARYDLVNALAARGMVERADAVANAYASNDGWMALTQREDTTQTAERLSIAALTAATVPGALVLVSLAGGMLWGFGVWVSRSARVRQIFAPPAAPIIGIVFALVAYWATGLLLASIAVVLCFTFLVFTPPRVRTLTPNDLGPLFRFTVTILGLGVGLALMAFLASLTTPACQMLSVFNVSRDYYGGSTLFLGLAGIVLGLLMLVSPGWALVQRIATPKVVGVAFRELGLGLCAGALGLAVMAGPAAVYADRELNQTLQMLVENEPNYYLLQ